MRGFRYPTFKVSPCVLVAFISWALWAFTIPFIDWPMWRSGARTMDLLHSMTNEIL
jgi:hypothetical protein